MSTNNDHDYVEAPIKFTKKEAVIISLILIFIFFEIKYMDVWCKWFTNC